MDSSIYGVNNSYYTNMTIRDFIKQGEELKASITGTKLTKVNEYDIWVETVLRFLNRTMPGDMAINRFQVKVRLFNPGYCYKNEFDNILSILRGVEAIPGRTVDTSAVIKQEKRSINVTTNVSQSQEQHQVQNQKMIDEILLDSIKDELNGKQRKELLAIANEFKDPDEAYVKVVGKLKEFGIDISTNIIANILTNPTVWTTIGSIL